MQFKIELQHNSQWVIIPINYQYHLRIALYPIFEKDAVVYSEFLHPKNKIFALKCFLEFLLDCGLGLYNAQGISHLRGNLKTHKNESV